MKDMKVIDLHYIPEKQSKKEIQINYNIRSQSQR